MLSKEEIHNCLSEVMKILAIANIDREDKKLGQYVCDLQKVENYIDKLEADKQKLIEKLEEEVTTDNIKAEMTKTEKILYRDIIQEVIEQTVKVVNEYRKEILKLAKGEKE